jgi:hypothetical protein
MPGAGARWLGRRCQTATLRAASGQTAEARGAGRGSRRAPRRGLVRRPMGAWTARRGRDGLWRGRGGLWRRGGLGGRAPAVRVAEWKGPWSWPAAGPLAPRLPVRPGSSAPSLSAVWQRAGPPASASASSSRTRAGRCPMQCRFAAPDRGAAPCGREVRAGSEAGAVRAWRWRGAVGEGSMLRSAAAPGRVPASARRLGAPRVWTRCARG